MPTEHDVWRVSTVTDAPHGRFPPLPSLHREILATPRLAWCLFYEDTARS